MMTTLTDIYVSSGLNGLNLGYGLSYTSKCHWEKICKTNFGIIGNYMRYIDPFRIYPDTDKFWMEQESMHIKITKNAIDKWHFLWLLYAYFPAHLCLYPSRSHFVFVNFCTTPKALRNRCRMMHICISELGHHRCQAITWSNADIFIQLHPLKKFTVKSLI